MSTQPTENLVVVAMSGGVDSSAAAVLLAEQGYDVVGVAMQVWDYRKNGGNAKRATCCAPGDFDDARHVAHIGDFPFYVFDFEDSFHEAVIAPFVKSYLGGSTPNPCVECNRKVKFKELRKRAKSLGAQKVATGHYAQIKTLPDGTLGLFTSKDLAKDQSYFLYALTAAELKETLFPVGAMKKEKVRAVLRERGLQIAEKDESQDICFVSTSVPEFIENHEGLTPKAGEIVTSSGETFGSHKGIHHFTVGQRKGLGGGARHPLYVLQIEPETNRVVVGSEDELKQERFEVDEVNWISGVPFEGRALVKVRYRHSGLPCMVRPLSLSRVEVTFEDTWSAICPGQSAVFYSDTPDAEGDVQVLGGGIISR